MPYFVEHKFVKKYDNNNSILKNLFTSWDTSDASESVFYQPRHKINLGYPGISDKCVLMVYKHFINNNIYYYD